MLVLLALLLVQVPTAQAVDPDELLPPEEAFALSVVATGPNTIVASWDIADGYYLYQHRFDAESETPGIVLGEPQLPPGIEKEDEFFGRVVTYRDSVAMTIPLNRSGASAKDLSLLLTSQGCADLGVCYPPQRQPIQLALAAAKPNALTSLLRGGDSSAGASDAGLGEEELLEPDMAFAPLVESPDGHTVTAQWQIADGYYLYRDKIDMVVVDGHGVDITRITTPEGIPKNDEFFGDIQVYYGDAVATAKLARTDLGVADIALRLKYQGCAEIGVCYPPMERDFPLRLALVSSAVAAESSATAAPPKQSVAERVEDRPTPISEQDRLARSLASGAAALTMATFFGLGLLLAFTPCVFPMVPILSGIIIGQGDRLTATRGLALSTIYVLSMALTYSVVGVLAGLFGANLQIWFQQTWLLVAFAMLFVLLSLSMFGFYELQLPSGLQTRIAKLSNRQKGGDYAGVAIMGFLSAVIVGPCVAPPLAGALIYIGQTGDALLGGLALFAMSLGMGAPLILIGASAGKLLPKAGPWMDAVKAVFGVGLLAVAIVLLERVVPAPVAMLFWGSLLIGSAIFMGALEPLADGVPGWRKLWKGMGLVLLVYGATMLIGAAAGGKDTLQPLRGVILAGDSSTHRELSFQTIKTVADLEHEIMIARADNRSVMLDFYADWCVSCKEMERYTFTDTEVIEALASTTLLQADVTANDEADQALLRRFEIIGPPAILFFGNDGEERRGYRVVGYMPAERFATHARNATL